MLLGSETMTRYRLRGAPIIHDTIDNETIAINQLTGAYYSIDGPGALVWQLLRDGATPTELVERLSGSFDSDRATIEAAVTAFIDELTTEELIVGEAAAHDGHDDGAARDSSLPSRSPLAQLPTFTGLRLQRYNDLEVMLLADPIHEVDDTGWPMPLTEDRTPATDSSG